MCLVEEYFCGKFKKTIKVYEYTGHWQCGVYWGSFSSEIVGGEDNAAGHQSGEA